MNTTGNGLPGVNFISLSKLFDIKIFYKNFFKMAYLFISKVRFPFGKTSMDLPQNFVFGLTSP